MNLLPCDSCPWRTDQDSSSIPGFKEDLARGLLKTVGPEDGFRKIMACHKSPQEKPFACRGYLAMEGYNNISVRLLVATGNSPAPQAVLDACEAHGVNLHPDYPSVLAKLRGE